MTDLISFVRARLDEREALYRKFVQPPADPRGGPHESWAMRDIIAKTAIVDAYEIARDADSVGAHLAGTVYGLGCAVAVLAAIDSSHPDYDESWRP
jgi:hypothetical protein